jgi:hypothetical protein
MGHTVGSEDGQPYSDEYPYNCVILTYPAPFIGTRVNKCNLSSGKIILFHHVFPITQEEFEFKEENGTTVYEMMCMARPSFSPYVSFIA